MRYCHSNCSYDRFDNDCVNSTNGGDINHAAELANRAKRALLRRSGRPLQGKEYDALSVHVDFDDDIVVVSDAHSIAGVYNWHRGDGRLTYDRKRTECEQAAEAENPDNYFGCVPSRCSSRLSR